MKLFGRKPPKSQNRVKSTNKTAQPARKIQDRTPAPAPASRTPPPSERKGPTTGERLIDYSQKTLYQSSRAASASEELLGLFNQDQGEKQDDPIQLLQETLAQLVELELSNAERLTRLEEALLRNRSGGSGNPSQKKRH